MSRETTLIILGLLIMALRTLMGLPGTWQTAALVVMGGAVAMIGFLLRGEALARGARRHPDDSYAESRPAAVETVPAHGEAEADSIHAHTPHHHGHEGIGSLN